MRLLGQLKVFPEDGWDAEDGSSLPGQQDLVQTPDTGEGGSFGYIRNMEVGIFQKLRVFFFERRINARWKIPREGGWQH